MSALRRVGCAAAFLLAALLVPAPATAEERPTSIFIEIHPSTVAPGLDIEIRASCGKKPKPAEVRSRVFGTIELVADGHGELVGRVTVPTGTRTGEHRVDLRCDDGSRARAELVVVEMKRPTRGPDTGGGGTASDGTTSDSTAGERTSGDRRDPPPIGTLLLAGAGAAALVGGAGLLLLRRGHRVG